MSAHKGQTPWNKGLPTPDDVKAKISVSLKGKSLGNTNGFKQGQTPWHMGQSWSVETRTKISVSRKGQTPWNKGIPWSAAHKASLRGPKSADARAKMAISAAKRYARGDFWKGPTSLEYALQLLLEDTGLEYETQVRFGRYVVDFYVPSRNLAFEADGMYWHQDEERETRRDGYLVDRGVNAVIHLDDEDLDSYRLK